VMRQAPFYSFLFLIAVSTGGIIAWLKNKKKLIVFPDAVKRLKKYINNN
jgi:hypothetical protein